MSITYLSQVADAVLDAAVDALAPATTGRAAITSAYVTHAIPAINRCCDGGQITVHLENVEHGQQYAATRDMPQHGCGILHNPTFVITYARCWPSFEAGGGDPTIEQWDTAAAELLEDLWALLTELADRIGACTLFPGMAACDDAAILDAVPLEAQGACAGWVIRVSLTTNDSGPTGS